MAKLKLVQSDDHLVKYMYSGSRMGRGYMTFLLALIIFPAIVSVTNSYDLSILSYLFTTLGFIVVGIGIMQISGNLILMSDRLEKSFTYNKDYVFISFGDTVPVEEIKKFTFHQIKPNQWEFTLTSLQGEISLFKSKNKQELLDIATHLKNAVDENIVLETIEN